LGGGVSYSALAAARLGVRVRALIGVDRDAAEAAEIELLRAAGVEVMLHPLASGPVFDNRSTADGRRQLALAASDLMPAQALPDAWRSVDAALIAPVAGELADEWSLAFEPATFVAVAAQGLLRRLQPGKDVVALPLEPRPLLERADVVALSPEDVAAGAPPVREWLRPGQQLLLTHGRRGALALSVTHAGFAGRYVPALPAREAIDATGAGDTFIAAWLAARLLVGDGWRPLAVAAAMSSLAVTGVGLKDMPTARDVCGELLTLRGSLAGGGT
jgi:sugar/nucleoside kinase (ribokinase family)